MYLFLYEKKNPTATLKSFKVTYFLRIYIIYILFREPSWSKKVLINTCSTVSWHLLMDCMHLYLMQIISPKLCLAESLYLESIPPIYILNTLQNPLYYILSVLSQYFYFAILIISILLSLSECRPIKCSTFWFQNRHQNSKIYINVHLWLIYFNIVNVQYYRLFSNIKIYK